MQYFCLHGILPFSKSYREIESTWSTAKCGGRKSFDMWCYSYLCNALCKFLNEIGNNKCFSKTYSEIESTWPINSRKKEIVLSRDSKELLCSVSWKFLIKIESTWRCKINEQAPQLTLLYRGRTVRSSQRRCCIRKLFLKILQYLQETPVSESIF